MSGKTRKDMKTHASPQFYCQTITLVGTYIYSIFLYHECDIQAINGDGKIGPNPLFRVNITLSCTSANQTIPKGESL